VILTGGTFLIVTLFVVKAWRSNRDALEQTSLSTTNALNQSQTG
jgi:hypothetical protein